MASRYIRDALEDLLQLYPNAHALWVELDPLPSGQQRSLREAEWDQELKQLSPKINIINKWAAKLQRGGLQLTAIQLGKMPRPQAQATLSRLHKLTRMEDTNAEVVRRLAPVSNSFLDSDNWLQALLAALLLPLLRWRGYKPYTVQMRSMLRDSAAEMALIIIALIIALIWLPTGGAKAAAAGAAATALQKSAGAIRQLWDKDDMPQRDRDIKQLEDSLVEARSMAADGGIVAGLAGAMAGKLKATLQRAVEALSAIERQPAAQQQPQQPPHQAPPGAAAMPPPSAHGMSLAGAAAAAEVPPGAVPAAAGAVPPGAVPAAAGAVPPGAVAEQQQPAARQPDVHVHVS